LLQNIVDCKLSYTSNYQLYYPFDQSAAAVPWWLESLEDCFTSILYF